MFGGAPPTTTPAYTQPTTPSAPSWSPPSYDINSDPGVLAARAAMNRGVTELDSWLRGQRTNAFVDFGDPNLVLPGFNLDANTKAMAQQNYKSGNSVLSRLDHAHELAARQIVNALAAHGILGSGDLGYRQGEENRQYGNNVYDARKSLLSQLNDYQQQYLSQKNALESALQQALQQAYSNQLAMASGY